ncbi:hypothetical protein CR513_09469, partial [Mucuna pruriens]
MRQHKWLEFLKDYTFNLSHHPGKANIVVNALSRKSFYGHLRDSSLVYEVTLKSMKLDMLKIGRVITHEKQIGVKIRIDEVMRFSDKIHVMDVTKLWIRLSSGLSAQLGAVMMYQNHRKIEVYLEEIARIHCVSLSGVSNRKLKFTLRFGRVV